MVISKTSTTSPSDAVFISPEKYKPIGKQLMLVYSRIQKRPSFALELVLLHYCFVSAADVLFQQGVESSISRKLPYSQKEIDGPEIQRPYNLPLVLLQMEIELQIN